MPAVSITIHAAKPEDVQFRRSMLWEAIQSSPQLIHQLGLEALQVHEENYWRHWVQHPDPAFIALSESGQQVYEQMGFVYVTTHEGLLEFAVPLSP
jgi:hypothetical protein